MILSPERHLRINQLRILGRTVLRGILSGYNGQPRKYVRARAEGVCLILCVFLKGEVGYVQAGRKAY
jgi:hypothetical protein